MNNALEGLSAMHLPMVLLPKVMIDYSKPLKSRAESRKIIGPYTWTPNDRHMLNGRNLESAGVSFYQERDSMDGRGSAMRFRIVQGKSRYRSEASDFYPLVAALPHGRGFLAGWTMGNGMLATLEGSLWDDPDDAMNRANDAASKAADEDQEYCDNMQYNDEHDE